MSIVPRIKSKVFRAYRELVFETPLISHNIKYPRRNIIIMYHGIDTAGRNLFNGRHTPIHFFEKQIRFLKTRLKVVPLKDYFENSNSQSDLCAITFDDGYLNNLTNALPILEKYNCPATFFITGMNEIGSDILWADYVNIVNKLCYKEVKIDDEVFVNSNENYVSKSRGLALLDIVKTEKCDYTYKEKIYAAFNNHVNFKKEEKYFEYWKLMTDEQIKLLSKSRYAEIGSHGYYHNNLGNISKDSAYDELTRSKKYLENLIQKEVTSIGYPDGSYSDSVSNYAADIGIVHQTCSEYFNKTEDRWNTVLKNRAGVYNFDSAGNQLLSALNHEL